MFLSEASSHSGGTTLRPLCLEALGELRTTFPDLPDVRSSPNAAKGRCPLTSCHSVAPVCGEFVLLRCRSFCIGTCWGESSDVFFFSRSSP